jgi:hypothetical protein
VTDPIIVPMAVSDGLVVPAGDRLVFDVRVANECGGERNVSVLYDSLGRASRLELVVPGVTTTTTTSSTTTTTLPVTCLDTATGIAAVRCRLEAMDAIVRGTSPASLGGPAFAGRLARRIDRALTFVRRRARRGDAATASQGAAPARAVRRAARARPLDGSGRARGRGSARLTRARRNGRAPDPRQRRMMRRGVAVGAATFAALLLAAPCARAADDLSLYFTLDPTSARVLEPGTPSGANVHEDAMTASEGETVTFGPFMTEAATDVSRLGIGPVAFSVFLATGASGMPDCAEVAIALTKEPPSGPSAPLASGHFTTSLVPKASLVDPIAGLAPMNGAKAARSLAVGDRLAFTITVTNRCADGAHSVRLL